MFKNDKYRILSNGHRFRVKWRLFPYLPFWTWLTQTNEGGGGHIMEWETKEEAEKYVSSTDIKPWVEV